MFRNISTFFIVFFLIGSNNLVYCGGLSNKDPRYALREYRRFILPNQMKVMLISDPTLQRGSASMTVAAGSMNDPRDSFGLAHFLEHMLFLGTEKYPDEGSYQKFISTHDGFSNAYTTDDRTNYHFEIDSNHLEEALDRFSQFFISPLFNQELLQREIKVVDEEHSKNISNDYRRIFQVKRKAFENGHPARHFATGTMRTLKGVTREKLINFYQNHYSSNQMMLAVAGPQNLDFLQELVIERFNRIKNLKLLEKLVSTKFMEKDPRFRLMRIKTIKDLRYLKLTFPLTKTLHHYKSRPLGMLGFLIGHEGFGSLLSLLKKKDLASSLSAGGGISNKSFSSFDVNIQLTKKGIKNYKKVIEYFFQYINLIRKHGLPRYIYEEVKLMSEIEYRFAEKLVGTTLVNTFSTLMMYYPMRTLESAPYLITEYKPRTFDSILYNLIPSNMLAILASRDVKTSEKEEFYSVEYSLTYNNPKWIKKWSKAKPNTYLKLPETNIFLPKRMGILDFSGELELTYQSILGLEKDGISPRVINSLKKHQGKTWGSIDKLLKGISPLAENEKTLRLLLKKHVLGKPQIILEDELVKLWFQQDFRFKKPKAKIILRIHSPKVYSSPRNAVLTQLYVDSILEGLNEFGYPVRLSGLDFNISYDKKGINLSFEGYSDRILELTKSFAINLKKIKINKNTFNTLKEIRTRNYKNFIFQQPYKQAFYFRSLLLEGKKFSIMDYEKEIKKIELYHLEEFTKSLYDTGFIEGFAFGNLNSTTLSSTIKEFKQILGIVPLSEEDRYTNSVRQIYAGKTHTIIRKMNEKNSAILIEFQIGQSNPKLLSELMLIEALLKAEFYNELRTKQQLGYIVDSSLSIIENTLGIIFLIQSSSNKSKILEGKIDAFIENFYSYLKNLTNFEIDEIKKALINKKLQKTNSINNEANRLYTIAFKKNAEFDIKSREIKAIEEITLNDILKFYQKFLMPPNQRKLNLRMMSHNIESQNFPGKNIISIANFKEKYICPKNCLP